MAQEDGDDGDPDDAPVHSLVGALEEAEVADQQGNLEEADAELVKGPSGIVEAGIWDEVLLGAQGDGETEAVLGFFSPDCLCQPSPLRSGVRSQAGLT
jgi:hypothetical protein